MSSKGSPPHRKATGLELNPNPAQVRNDDGNVPQNDAGANLRQRIVEAKHRLRIEQLWVHLGLPGEPSQQCKSPFRDDKSPSFSIYADGLRWKDFSTGESGDAPDFLAKAKGIDNRQAVAMFLDLAGHQSIAPVRFEIPPKKEVVRPERKPDLTRVREASPDEFRQIANSRQLSVEAIEHAHNIGTLRVCPEFRGKPSWVLFDASGRCAECRRIDRQRYTIDGIPAKAAALRHSDKTWPVGIHLPYGHSGSEIAIAEGGPDYLAFIHFALRFGLKNIQPVAMLGRGLTISAEALPHFRNRRVRIYPHNDSDGLGYSQAVRLTRQLGENGCGVHIRTLVGLVKTDGKPPKDLNECVELSEGQDSKLEALFL
jgi:CHC2 zinc finger